MGWSLGFDRTWDRDIGYGVPAICDHPNCGKEIDRGLDYVCGDDIKGGENGCGLFFCGDHKHMVEEHNDRVCARCAKGEGPFDPAPDTPAWTIHKLTDPSWQAWREAEGIESGLVRALEDSRDGSRLLDAAIEDHFYPLKPDEAGHRSHRDFVGESEFEESVPEYTRSVDAAINLAEAFDLNVSQIMNDALEGDGGLWVKGFQAEGYVGQIAKAICTECVRTTQEEQFPCVD